MSMPTENYIYLAGPMTNKPLLNFPAFMAAAKQLRSEGIQVWNPAEKDLDDGIDPRNPRDIPLWHFMRIDLAAVCGAKAVYVLPDWMKSKGAKKEYVVATWCNIPVIDYTTRKVIFAGE